MPASGGLLANDTDVDTATLAHCDPRDRPSHGTLTLNPDGSFTYVPDPNYNGTDTFTYQVSDGTTTSAPVTVTLNVGDERCSRPAPAATPAARASSSRATASARPARR